MREQTGEIGGVTARPPSGSCRSGYRGRKSGGFSCGSGRCFQHVAKPLSNRRSAPGCRWFPDSGTSPGARSSACRLTCTVACSTVYRRQALLDMVAAPAGCQPFIACFACRCGSLSTCAAAECCLLSGELAEAPKKPLLGDLLPGIGAASPPSFSLAQRGTLYRGRRSTATSG